MKKLSTTLQNLTVILSLIGIIDTIYLINLHYSSGLCVGELQSIGNLVIDCGAVASSQYSEIAGIPIALFGFLYYLTIFVLYSYIDKIDPFLQEKFNTNVFFIASFLIGIGFLVSMYLLYLQIIVLQLI